MTHIEKERVWKGGEVLFVGLTDWSKPGLKFQKRKRNDSKKTLLDLVTPHRLPALTGVKICFVSSGSSASHCIAADVNGLCFAWGRNEWGQLGLGDSINRKIPTIIEDLVGRDIIGGACGKKHTAFVAADGDSLTCGSNVMGQCGTGVMKSNAKFEELIKTPVEALVKKCSSVACGAEFSLWLCDGKIYAAGDPQHGTLGDGSDHQYNAKEASIKLKYDPAPAPQLIQSLKENHIMQIAAGPQHCLAVDSDGIVYSWGYGGDGRLGHKIPGDEYLPKPIQTFLGKTRADVENLILVAGGTSSFCTATNDLLYSWGHRKPKSECDMYPHPFYDLIGWKIRSMACGPSTFVVAAEQSVITWGVAHNGELAKGPNGKKSCANPEKCEKLEDMYTHQVACGVGFSLFLVDPSDDKLSDVPTFDPEAIDSKDEETASEQNFVECNKRKSKNRKLSKQVGGGSKKMKTRRKIKTKTNLT